VSVADVLIDEPETSSSPPKTDPVATFRASVRASPRRYAVLLAGLALYAVALALMLQGGRGLGPWDVLHDGLSRHLGIGVGMANVLVALVLVATLWRSGRFGVGTLLNAVLIGLLLDVVRPFIPVASSAPVGWTMHLAGTLGVGLATGLYLAAALGSGPRDTLMLVTMQRTGRSARTVRTAIELVVLAGGALLGGTVGLGTLVFALGIGPATQLGLRWFAPELARPSR